jgi:hypothetical protein
MVIRLNGSVLTIAIVLAALSLGIAPAFAADQETEGKQEAKAKPVPEQKTGWDEASVKEIIVVTGTAIR